MSSILFKAKNKELPGNSQSLFVLKEVIIEGVFVSEGPYCKKKLQCLCAWSEAEATSNRKQFKKS